VLINQCSANKRKVNNNKDVQPNIVHLITLAKKPNKTKINHGATQGIRLNFAGHSGLQVELLERAIKQE